MANPEPRTTAAGADECTVEREALREVVDEIVRLPARQRGALVLVSSRGWSTARSPARSTSARSTRASSSSAAPPRPGGVGGATPTLVRGRPLRAGERRPPRPAAQAATRPPALVRRLPGRRLGRPRAAAGGGLLPEVVDWLDRSAGRTRLERRGGRLWCGRDGGEGSGDARGGCSRRDGRAHGGAPRAPHDGSGTTPPPRRRRRRAPGGEGGEPHRRREASVGRSGQPGRGAREALLPTGARQVAIGPWRVSSSAMRATAARRRDARDGDRHGRASEPRRPRRRRP